MRLRVSKGQYANICMTLVQNKGEHCNESIHKEFLSPEMGAVKTFQMKSLYHTGIEQNQKIFTHSHTRVFLYFLNFFNFLFCFHCNCHNFVPFTSMKITAYVFLSFQVTQMLRLPALRFWRNQKLIKTNKTTVRCCFYFVYISKSNGSHLTDKFIYYV